MEAALSLTSTEQQQTEAINVEQLYFANLEDKNLVDALTKRVKEFDQYMDDIGRVERIRISWELLYAMNDGADFLRKAGKQGEIIKLSINNFRAFLNNIVVLLTQAMSYFECEAENMDFKTQAECILGKSIVDYYQDEAGIGADFAKAVWDCLTFGEVFYELDWDESLGEPFAQNPGTGHLENKGDVAGKMHNSLNVIRDVNLKSSKQNRWYLVRDCQDKYDLAATYPEHAAHILAQKPPEESGRYQGRDSIYFKIRQKAGATNDNIETWRFYHEKTKACRGGREALIIGGKVISSAKLTENYGEVPLKRFAAGDIEGTWLPFSLMWDLVPLCQASNSLSTAQITNAINLALTNIWSPDPKTNISQLAQGMALINSAQEPKSLNLGKGSPEVEKGLNFLQQKSQFLTGINSVAAGQPEAVSNIKSGNGLALILSTAVQFQAPIQGSYALFRQDVMSLLIRIMQKKATMPMLISVSGKSKARYAKTFKNKDIMKVRRVKCSLASPIMATLGGRLQIADNIASKFPNAITIQQYIAILQTGNLDHIEAASFDEQMAMLAENEAMNDGKVITVNILENHMLHIREHLKLIATPDSKNDGNLIERVTSHILEHFQNWQKITLEMPALLTVIGIPPLQGPVMNSATGQDGKVPSSQPNNAGDASNGMPELPASPMPSMPSLPPGAPEGLQAAYSQVNAPPRVAAGALQ